MKKYLNAFVEANKIIEQKSNSIDRIWDRLYKLEDDMTTPIKPERVLSSFWEHAMKGYYYVLGNATNKEYLQPSADMFELLEWWRNKFPSVIGSDSRTIADLYEENNNLSVKLQIAIEALEKVARLNKNSKYITTIVLLALREIKTSDEPVTKVWHGGRWGNIPTIKYYNK